MTSTPPTHLFFSISLSFMTAIATFVGMCIGVVGFVYVATLTLWAKHHLWRFAGAVLLAMCLVLVSPIVDLAVGTRPGLTDVIMECTPPTIPASLTYLGLWLTLALNFHLLIPAFRLWGESNRSFEMWTCRGVAVGLILETIVNMCGWFQGVEWVWLLQLPLLIKVWIHRGRYTHVSVIWLMAYTLFFLLLGLGREVATWVVGEENDGSSVPFYFLFLACPIYLWSVSGWCVDRHIHTQYTNVAP